jgi:hypothetical protein
MGYRLVSVTGPGCAALAARSSTSVGAALTGPASTRRLLMRHRRCPKWRSVGGAAGGGVRRLGMALAERADRLLSWGVILSVNAERCHLAPCSSKVTVSFNQIRMGIRAKTWTGSGRNADVF